MVQKIRKIVDLELKKVEKRLLKTKDVKIKFSKPLCNALAEKGYDPNLGARPLRRVIQKLILDPLSLKIITSQIKEGDRVFADFENGEVVFQSPRTFSHRKRETALAK